MFESDVISDGTQTFLRSVQARIWFESDVISDGTQTALFVIKMQNSFKQLNFTGFKFSNIVDFSR